MLFHGIKPAEVDASMYYHAMNRRGKSSIDAPNSILPVDILQEISEALELSVASTADVGCNACMCNVEWVDEDQARATSHRTCEEIGRGVAQRAPILRSTGGQ